MTINMIDYWPNPATGEQLLVQDATKAYGPETLSVLHRYKKGGTVNGLQCIQLDDYTSNGWVDAWEYRFDATAGMLEVGDKTSNSHLVYFSGKEIKWGNVQNVGDSISGSIQVDVSKSSGVSAGAWNYGSWALNVEAVLPTFTNDGGLVFANVVQIWSLQSWCKDNACVYPSGQNITQSRYWLAPGVGIIQTDYLAPSARRDYAKSVTRTCATA